MSDSELPQTGFGLSIRKFGTCRPRPNIIRFDQTPDAGFFMCRRCRNHVLSEDNYLFDVPLLDVIISQNPVNVRADDIEQRWNLLHQPVVRVFCNACDKYLGLKFVMVETPTEVIQEGRFMFYRERILPSNGIRVVHPDTDVRVEDN